MKSEFNNCPLRPENKRSHRVVTTPNASQENYIKNTSVFQIKETLGIKLAGNDFVPSK